MQKLLFRVYTSRRLGLSFKIISHAAVIISVLSYALILYTKFRCGYTDACIFIAVSAVPFFIVTAFRAIVDAPRPYEIYDFYKVKPKGKAGKSFPSRHVFSAAMISVLAFPVSIPLAAALFALSVALSAARVALGIHFIRDVAAGALLGFISGIIAIFI